ncbi:MAG: glycosyltransferase family 2 protein, partial [Prevotella sp.]|nr:glycosyltransferase family 2 protein [Prevotella sp.]
DLESEVIVVDNHSSDDTVAYIRKNYSWVRVIANNHNLGFAKANNIALRLAKGEYVLFVNPDVVVAENTVKECVDVLAEHPETGALGVCMLNRDGTRALESRRGIPTPMTAFYKMSGLCKIYPKSRRFGRYYMGWLPWDVPVEIEIVSGAFTMLRTSVMREMNGYDEEYFMYGEDIDLSYRLLKAGYKNLYLPNTILHYKGESTHKSSFRYVHVFYEAMLIFLQKHFGQLSVLLTIPIKLAIYVRALGALVKMSVHRLKKMLGFTIRPRRKQPVYVCVGDQDMLDMCKEKIDEKAYEGVYVMGNATTLPSGHSSQSERLLSEYPDKDIVVVYDTASYSYADIFDIFMSNANPNMTIGFYYADKNIIITPNEIVE